MPEPLVSLVLGYRPLAVMGHISPNMEVWFEGTLVCEGCTSRRKFGPVATVTTQGLGIWESPLPVLKDLLCSHLGFFSPKLTLTPSGPHSQAGNYVWFCSPTDGKGNELRRETAVATSVGVCHHGDLFCVPGIGNVFLEHRVSINLSVETQPHQLHYQFWRHLFSRRTDTISLPRDRVSAFICVFLK